MTDTERRYINEAEPAEPAPFVETKKGLRPGVYALREDLMARRYGMDKPPTLVLLRERFATGERGHNKRWTETRYYWRTTWPMGGQPAPGPFSEDELSPAPEDHPLVVAERARLAALAAREKLRDAAEEMADALERTLEHYSDGLPDHMVAEFRAALKRAGRIP